MPEKFNINPVSSEIRSLIEVKGGSFAHCSLPPDSTSISVSHTTIDEIWYFIRSRGEMEKIRIQEEVVKVSIGVCLSIPKMTYFQFRYTGHEPLSIVIVTMPACTGNQEAMKVKGSWTSTIEPSS